MLICCVYFYLCTDPAVYPDDYPWWESTVHQATQSNPRKNKREEEEIDGRSWQEDVDVFRFTEPGLSEPEQRAGEGGRERGLINAASADRLRDSDPAALSSRRYAANLTWDQLIPGFPRESSRVVTFTARSVWMHKHVFFFLQDSGVVSAKCIIPTGFCFADVSSLSPTVRISDLV